MKKFVLFCSTAILVIFLNACGTEKATESSPENQEKNIAATEPTEPTEETLCAFCNMKVYTKDNEMGVFTAQGVTEKGEHLHFDDSGCLLNYERKTNEKLTEKWVRNYITSEWVEADSSIPVYSDIETPMKYGYSFFDSEKCAQAFVQENGNLNSSITDWETIDGVAKERFEKKMQMQNGMNKDEK